MRQGKRINVIIPALNEERALPHVLADIPDWVDRVVVVDNGSTDLTADVARQAGAHVVCEPQRGYGAACLRGMQEVEDADIVVFLDADHSDYPEELGKLVAPVLAGEADLVIGSRIQGGAGVGVLTVPQWFGNKLACGIMRLAWRGTFTDLGPFRAIRRDALSRLGMRDTNYGWTVEMQIKALLHRLATAEVPVRYRARIGTSKISGTVKGTVLAGTKILWVLFRSYLAHRRHRSKLLVPTRKDQISSRA